MLHPVRLGVAGGVVCGVALFLCTLFAVWTGHAAPYLHLLVDVYPGYTVSGIGSVVGLFWGFVKGFVGFYVLAWIYNKLSDKF
jgi:hypothetical protein